MSGFGNTAVGLSKNPLGIIALAFVFVYAIAGLFTSQTDLEESLLWVLILFLVLFPCLVLYVFYRLVTEHHTKLYAPSDYSNEDNFVRALQGRVHDLETLTEQIAEQIGSQPLYRYMKLGEAGKQIALFLYSDTSFELVKFAENQRLDVQEVLREVRLVESYGWCSVAQNQVQITEKGKVEIGTFNEFCYARFE
ncbi:hypothetical protein ABRZ87_21475 [Vibrio vulnificus]|uniref:hypothetical protein n=1 Tax=Vibrio vulnificus TaxID=672 RepID=UPI0012FCEB73|nr:hypothetical protein [Vibrio vulnificus]MBN8156656.1 hypothetical protein [Vibrio vulnificus]MCA0778813.1 hypothetical protein [Vibrio vulnificus]MCJ0819734.1 hypothetical protein [Vibrio vulnificus]MCU8518902.1 hypothetical protein [Vibrio vulnificus]MCU8540781.1 hypothetical protein [Vibrio vulnificus]